MMSLGVAKGGLLPPSDEDRRRIIRQMKVRTPLRGDQSWIQHRPSDEDEEKGSPRERSSASKPQPGYLIRGVFTRTIDKSSPDSSPSSQAQKKAPQKGQSRSPSGYRMTTEDYKKLAPYNVRQKSGAEDEEEAPFSPDEHKKRAEAASSVLRRSAGRERAYVLSAARKGHGSPSQELPALFAKRIEIEEEEGQQRRSPTVPGAPSLTRDSSSANGLRKSSWDGAKPAAASPSSPKPGSRSQTPPSLSDTLGKISISAEPRDAEHRQELKSSLEKLSQEGDGDKALQEKPERFPWEEGAPRATNGSFPEHTEANNGFYPPEPGDALEKLLRPPEPSQGDARSPLQSDVPFHPTERTPVHMEDTEYSFKRFLDPASLTERGPGAPGHDSPPEPPRLEDPAEPSRAGSSSAPGGSSSIPAPEIAHAKESEPHQDRCELGSQHSQHSQQSVPSALQPRPLLQERQALGGSVPSHRIPAYVDSQVFSSRRPSPDAQGSVYSGSSWYDSARGHGDFSPAAGRDATMSMAQRSHRVPFYMDSLNSTRLLSSSSERLHHSPGYQPDPSTAGRGILFVKEYVNTGVNTGGFAASPRHGSGSLVDLSDLERSSYSQHSFLSSAPLHRSSEPLCSYCSREIRDCPKIIIEHLNIHCHEYCFRCGICHKAMGDLLDKIFIHRDIVHCDKCYEKLF